MAAKKSKNNTQNRTVNQLKQHLGREVVPVRLMPSGVMGARYRDDEFSVVMDHNHRPIPYKLLP